jgi:hypothetical protein
LQGLLAFSLFCQNAANAGAFRDRMPFLFRFSLCRLLQPARFPSGLAEEAGLAMRAKRKAGCGA